MEKADTPCDKKTFRQLFDEYAEGLQNFIFYKSGNVNLAEDCVQEAFIRLWNNCSKVPLEKVKSYLFTVANNLFVQIRCGIPFAFRRSVRRMEGRWWLSAIRVGQLQEGTGWIDGRVCQT